MAVGVWRDDLAGSPLDKVSRSFFILPDMQANFDCRNNHGVVV
jgi:hypothetical protein